MVNNIAGQFAGTAKNQCKITLIKNLYDEPLKYYEDRLKELVKENNRIHGSNEHFGKILYKGAIYTYRPTGHYRHVKCFDLDPSLFKDMDNFLLYYKVVVKEKENMSRFLSVFLTFCKHQQDVERLLSTTIYEMIKDLSRHLEAPPRSEDELDWFKDEYGEQLEKLNQRYLDNIVMKNHYRGTV